MSVSLCSCQVPVESPVTSRCAGTAPYCTDDQSVARCLVVLDNSATDLVIVDNASSLSNSHVAELVLAADRSTQNWHVVTPPFLKGLMRDGDRVCVTDSYLAWFDYSHGDGGIVYGVPYAPWTRPGVLAGLWTLDPATQWFRNLVPTSDGFSWMANELIPGSSAIDGPGLFWDPNGPPTENGTFAFPKSGHEGAPVIPWTQPVQSRYRQLSGSDNVFDFHFFSFMYVGDSPWSGWRTIDDGWRDAEGVHYTTRGFMASWDTHSTDVTDDSNGNGVTNQVDAIAEYICRPTDVRMRWSVRATDAPLAVDSVYVMLWLAYASNEDDTLCDAGGPGRQWPRNFSRVPRYVQSSEMLASNWDYVKHSPGRVAELQIQAPCQRRNDGTYPDYTNYVLATFPEFSIHAGSWIQMGVSPDPASLSPTTRFTVLSDPSIGSGSEQDPIGLRLHDCGAFHEDSDGTVGIGCGTQGHDTVLPAGVWTGTDILITPVH